VIVGVNRKQIVSRFEEWLDDVLASEKPPEGIEEEILSALAESVFEKFQATLQGINVAFVKLEIARQSICHRRERRSMGTTRPTFVGSATRRSAAHNRYSGCDQRDFLSAAHRLPVASSSAGVSSLGHRVSLFPDVEELRCVEVSATSNL
jgi:hypothetical protein